MTNLCTTTLTLRIKAQHAKQLLLDIIHLVYMPGAVLMARPVILLVI